MMLMRCDDDSASVNGCYRIEGVFLLMVACLSYFIYLSMRMCVFDASEMNNPFEIIQK